MRSFCLSFRGKLSNRLEHLIKTRGINTQQLHRYTGIPLSTLKRLRLNKQNNPTLASLIPIAKFFSVSIDQLIGINPLESNNSPYKSIKIPIIDWENALKRQEDRCKLAFSSLVINDAHLSQASYALITKEHKLVNFLSGSLLIIDPHLKPNNRDFLIVHRKEQTCPELCRLLIAGTKRYLSNSTQESEIVLFTNHYKSLGVVTQIRMNYKNGNIDANLKGKNSLVITKKC